MITALVVGACGRGEDPSISPPPGSSPGEGGLTLTLVHTEPLRARAPVTWTLQLRNRGPGPVTLTFSSGQQGDVALRQGGQERYRWSRGRAFTQVFAELALGPGEARSFELKDQRLGVEPGQYELVASLTSQPAPPDVARTVTVAG
ncbi:MAG: BsuPI-related putative proteinase inhibitor [Actinomycetota bacterium]|nr:BsuPI-related putative proteinase inhibitor [Actinomycetota bacterium]